MDKYLKIIMIVVLIIIAYNDWTKKKINNAHIILIFMLGVLRCFAVHELKVAEQIAGLFSVSIPMVFLDMIYPKCFGGGDIKLMSAAGLFLGAISVWRAFSIGVVVAGVYVGIKIILMKNTRKDIVAFGPFLVFGIFLCML